MSGIRRHAVAVRIYTGLAPAAAGAVAGNPIFNHTTLHALLIIPTWLSPAESFLSSISSRMLLRTMKTSTNSGRPSGRGRFVCAARVDLLNVKATMGVYPFMFGAAKDFEPIVDEMAKVGPPSLLMKSDPVARHARALQLGRVCPVIYAKSTRAGGSSQESGQGRRKGESGRILLVRTIPFATRPNTPTGGRPPCTASRASQLHDP